MCRADVPVLALPQARMASRVTYRSSTIKALFRLYYGSVLCSMKVLLRPHEGCIMARLRVYECSNLRALGVERHLVARDLSDYEKLAVAIATQVTLTHTHSHSHSPYTRVF